MRYICALQRQANSVKGNINPLYKSINKKSQLSVGNPIEVLYVRYEYKFSCVGKLIGTIYAH